MRENYSKPEVSLAEAADLCNVSQEYLSRLFQQETGTKFISFLQNSRQHGEKNAFVRPAK